MIGAGLNDLGTLRPTPPVVLDRRRVGGIGGGVPGEPLRHRTEGGLQTGRGQATFHRHPLRRWKSGWSSGPSGTYWDELLGDDDE